MTKKKLTGNERKIKELMEHSALMQAFVFNALGNEANRVREHFDQHPEELEDFGVISGRLWLSLANDVLDTLHR